MTERDLTRILTESVQDVHLSDDARRRIRLAAKEEPKVKKKMNIALVLGMVLMLLTTVGVAANLGMFDFLARHMGTNVLPGASSVTDLALAETDHAVFTIAEAAYDGRGASVMVRVTPKAEKTFLLYEGGDRLSDPASALTGDDACANMTIGDYAKAQGYEQLVEVSAALTNLRTGVSVVDAQQNNELILVFGFEASGEELPLVFEGATVPFDRNGFLDRMQDQHTAPASFTLKAEAPLWTAQVTASAEVPASGLRIDGVTLTGTSLTTYADIDLSITDEKAWGRVRITVTDSQGKRLAPGATFMGGGTTGVEDGRASVHACVTAMEKAPEMLYLRVYDYKTNEETLLALPVAK